MPVTFNLIEQPWIPCIRSDGSTTELSLFDTLACAHELYGLEAGTPQETASLLRLLLAVLHRVYDTRDEEAWGEIWFVGQFDAQKIQGYLSRWEDRFDLFHPSRPFYQSTNDPVDPKPLLTLRPGMRSAGLYFHDAEEGKLLYSPAQAARMLVNAHTFGTPGIVHPQKGLYLSNAPWLAGLLFFLEGENLFQTLALNLLQYAPNHPHPNLCKTPEDAPAWEMESPYTPERTFPIGYLDYLTWHNRRIHLLPHIENGQLWVKEVIEAPGLKLVGEIPDPMKHYVLDKSKGRKLLWFNPAKALWRHSSTFLSLRSKDQSPPACLNWIAQVIDWLDLPISTRMRLATVGVKVENQSKIVMHRLERFPLPVAYLEREDLVSSLAVALDQSEAVRNKLYNAVFTLAKTLEAINQDLPDGRDPLKADVNALMSHWAWETTYWPALELPFLTLVEELPNDEPEAALADWRKTLVQTAWQTLEAAIQLAGDHAAALKAAVKARAALGGGLKKLDLIPTEPKVEV